MSRLIRDTDILDKLASWRDSLYMRDPVHAVTDGILETVEDIVGDIDDAYSVEAVVRELEELRDSVDNEYAQFCFERAIYAVKRGGRDE